MNFQSLLFICGALKNFREIFKNRQIFKVKYSIISPKNAPENGKTLKKKQM